MNCLLSAGHERYHSANLLDEQIIAASHAYKLQHVCDYYSNPFPGSIFLLVELKRMTTDDKKRLGRESPPGKCIHAKQHQIHSNHNPQRAESTRKHGKKNSCLMKYQAKEALLRVTPHARISFNTCK